ncbi:FtsX-like permease family protein [Streptomyces sp. ECR3]|uniref:FtsX-like permease family protein n=1 Tax=Streptomyces sp. ECR3 TaxID=3400630 RepID=UPI003F1DB870
MNFVKRAGLSRWARRGRTLLTLAAFLVISVMVLAGILINDATARAERSARRSVGAEVRLDVDLGATTNTAGGLQAPRIDAATVDALGALPQVRRYTYSMWDRALLKGRYKLVGTGASGSGNDANGMGPGGTASVGVLDSSLLPDFRSGRFTLLSGAHLTAADKNKKRVLIEERLARKNRLRVGDRLPLTGNDEKTTAEFTVAGVYRDPRPRSEPEPEYGVSPADMLYGTVGGLSALDPQNGHGKVPLRVGGASFLLRDADDEAAFESGARKLAGAQLDGFGLDTNDKAVRQMTGPLRSIRSTATVAMWLMGLAGAAVLALLVNLAVKQRRPEYGVLLAMGERKGRLIAQQALEILVLAALALGVSALCAPALTQSAGQSLLGREAAAAKHRLDSWQAPPPGSTGLGEGVDREDEPVENADPIDRITVRLDAAELTTVGILGLGIGLLATALPASAVLRLSPRSILTKGQ